MTVQPSGLWSWDACKDKLVGLRGRLGFPDQGELRFLGLSVDLGDGSVTDDLTGGRLRGEDPWSRYMVQTVFYVLSGYSEAEHVETPGRLMSYKQLRGARFGDLDNRRTRDRIIERFRGDPGALVACAERLEGERVEFPYGDVAVRLEALPLVPLTIILSCESAEFEADARVFYDETVQGYLDVERINFLTNLAVSRLAAASKRL
ncbi:MAG: DUF3786 domain-containing protein [Candidatus Bathyarchaeota archaeon]